MAHELESASEALAALRDLLLSHPYPYLAAVADEGQALIAIERGSWNEATDSFRQAITRFEACGNDGDLARCERLLAETLTRNGSEDNQAEVRTRLKRARGLAEQVGAQVELNRVDSLGRTHGLRLRSGRPKKMDAGTLSPRELEVAALVAEGETNAGIATRLFLSDRTVEDHITHALRKLQLTSRAALASWAARNGLL